MFVFPSLHHLAHCLGLQKSPFLQPRRKAAAQNTNVSLASLHSQAGSRLLRAPPEGSSGLDLDSNRQFPEALGEFTSDLGHRENSFRHRQSSIWPEELARQALGKNSQDSSTRSTRELQMLAVVGPVGRGQAHCVQIEPCAQHCLSLWEATELA